MFIEAEITQQAIQGYTSEWVKHLRNEDDSVCCETQAAGFGITRTFL